MRLGRAKVMGGHQPDDSITYTSLRREGCESVLVTGRNGLEFVVYNFDQVDILSVQLE